MSGSAVAAAGFRVVIDRTVCSAANVSIADTDMHRTQSSKFRQNSSRKQEATHNFVLAMQSTLRRRVANLGPDHCGNKKTCLTLHWTNARTHAEHDPSPQNVTCRHASPRFLLPSPFSTFLIHVLSSHLFKVLYRIVSCQGMLLEKNKKHDGAWRCFLTMSRCSLSRCSPICLLSGPNVDLLSVDVISPAPTCSCRSTSLRGFTGGVVMLARPSRWWFHVGSVIVHCSHWFLAIIHLFSSSRRAQYSQRAARLGNMDVSYLQRSKPCGNGLAFRGVS